MVVFCEYIAAFGRKWCWTLPPLVKGNEQCVRVFTQEAAQVLLSDLNAAWDLGSV